MPPHVGRLVALALLTLGLLALRIVAPEPLRQLQSIGFDLPQGIAPAAEADSRLAVVLIDEASLARGGPWPWRRDRLAALVDDIAALGAASVTIGLLLDQPDRYAGAALAEVLGDTLAPGRHAQLAEVLSALPDADAALARTLGRIPTALATSVTTQSVAGSSRASVFPLPGRAVLTTALPEFSAVTAPIGPLRDAARAEGAVNLLPEIDMVLRRAPLFFLVEGVAHPTLPVASLMAAGRSVTLVGRSGERFGVALDGALRPTDAHGVAWLDFGRRKRIPVLSASTLDDAPTDALEGRIVVIGLDAVGLSMSWRLADGGLASGPEVVALIADALDVGSLLHRSVDIEIVEVGVLLAGMTVVVALWLGTAPRTAAATTAALVLAWVVGVLVARVRFGVVLDLLLPVLFWGLVATAALGLHAAALWRARRVLVGALEARSEAAETAARAKARFLAEMHHDLRTPLNAVLGFSSLIEAMPAVAFTPETGREYARTISIAGEHILRLSERALQAAELNNDTDPRRQIVNVDDVLLDAVQIAEAGHHFTRRIETRLGPGPLCVSADPTHLTEAVLNLIDNALRHGGAEGVVTLAASRVPGERVAIDVLDRGPGMSPDLRAKIGTPFLPGRAERDGVRGAGLGLYIVRSFAERHSGRLELLDRDGGGLHARIELPACNAPTTP